METLVSTQIKKLEQKKVRSQQQEAILKLKERKARIRHLIAIGGLVVKAQIDHLPSDVLLGACLYIKDSIQKDSHIVNSWKKLGTTIFEQETKNKTPVLLKLDQKPELSIRTLIRSRGLKWNALRQEWYGYAENIASLKKELGDLKFSLEILKI